MEAITRSERKRMYIFTRSEHERREIITLVEDYSFLHAPYIDINLIILY